MQFTWPDPARHRVPGCFLQRLGRHGPFVYNGKWRVYIKLHFPALELFMSSIVFSRDAIQVTAATSATYLKHPFRSDPCSIWCFRLLMVQLLTKRHFNTPIDWGQRCGTLGRGDKMHVHCQAAVPTRLRGDNSTSRGHDLRRPDSDGGLTDSLTAVYEQILAPEDNDFTLLVTGYGRFFNAENPSCNDKRFKLINEPRIPGFESPRFLTTEF